MRDVMERRGSFLAGYKFFPNNIEFRITSSRALEKWKNVQAFQLDQLLNGRFFFPKDRKEILLLKYEICTRWLTEVESLCVELSGVRRNSTEEDINVILGLSEVASGKFRELVMDKGFCHFEQQFSTIWMDVHKSIDQYNIKLIRGLEGKRFSILFSELVDLTCSVMQHMLTEIHELDAVFCNQVIECRTCPSLDTCPYFKQDGGKNEVPFIVISKFTEEAFLKYGECLVTQRLMVYQRHFDFANIYIKNYTDYFVSSELIHRIEGLGYEIDFRRSLMMMIH